MTRRTFVIGDIHGEFDQLRALMSGLPKLSREDTIVFLGDYMDRGSDSLEVVNYVRFSLPKTSPARIVALRGNHEDAWLRVATKGWPEFTEHPANGCLAAIRSWHGQVYNSRSRASADEEKWMATAAFLPRDVLEWIDGLPYWYEDEQAIYVHAGVPEIKGRWPHPSEVKDKAMLLWLRTREFFTTYDGKRIVVGHTTTKQLPQEYSSFTPDDPDDLWAGDHVIAIDTGCGKGGFLTAVELPACKVYESRKRPS